MQRNGRNVKILLENSRQRHPNIVVTIIYGHYTRGAATSCRIQNLDKRGKIDR